MCDVYVYMHKHERLGGSGGMLPQEIRFSEIASEAIFGQKQSCSSYMARRFVCCINFVLAQSTYALPMLAEFEFPKVDRAAGGMTSQEGQLVNSRPPEVLFTHIFMRILSSQVCNGVNSLLTRSALVIQEGQLVNSRPPEVLFIYAHPFIASLQRSKQLTHAFRTGHPRRNGSHSFNQTHLDGGDFQ